MQIIWFSVGAGILAMGFGGLFSALLFRRSSERITCWLLSFAAGIMTSVVCFGLMPEAVELSGMTASVAGLILGIVVIMLLNRIVDEITQDKGENLNV
ncbi:MAG: hypothetical protein FWE60_04100, partial [Oscillospiraceae bacterium]|nr:hypothetical protein [Oscillospiraceae bacterium]